jgi:hypothetical protein
VTALCEIPKATPFAFGLAGRAAAVLPLLLPLKAFKSIQTHPNAFKRIQKHPKASKSIKKHPKALKRIKTH